jgi:hypothetical protein
MITPTQTLPHQGGRLLAELQELLNPPLADKARPYAAFSD